MERNCLLDAWRAHESELRGYLRRRLPERSQADDLLQDIFVKVLGQGPGFCSVENARAWLFQVARNALADRLRLAREEVELPDDLAHETHEPEPVDTLAQCRPVPWRNSPPRTGRPLRAATWRG